MVPSVWQKLEQGVRHAIPAATTLFLIFLGVLVWPLPFVGAVAPMLALAGVYYWAIYRPDLFRPAIVFLLGLLNDALHFLPLGLTALVFVALYQLVFSQRRFFVRQTFFVVWFGFCVVALLAATAKWALMSILGSQMIAPLPVLIQFFLTVALFPLPAWALIRLHRAFLSQG